MGMAMASTSLNVGFANYLSDNKKKLNSLRMHKNYFASR